MTSQIHKVIDLGIGSAGCHDIRVTMHGGSVLVEVPYSVGRTYTAQSLLFHNAIAFRFRDEMHSLGFWPEANDTVIDVVDSIWLKELANIEPAGLLYGIAGKRHFAVLFSNNGFLEIVADDVQVQSPDEG